MKRKRDQSFLPLPQAADAIIGIGCRTGASISRGGAVKRNRLTTSGPAIFNNSVQFLVEQSSESFIPHLFKNEAQTGALPPKPIAMTFEQSSNGLGNPNRLIRRRPFQERAGNSRVRAHPPADEDPVPGEAAFAPGDESEIGDLSQPAIRPAAAERDLEFARQRPAPSRLSNSLRDFHCRLSDVETLLRTDACVGAGGDISDGVATAPLDEQPRVEKPAHDLGRILKRDTVQLHILPGGYVQIAISEPTAQFRKPERMLDGNYSGGDPDADHVPSVLPLFVDSPRRPQRLEFCVRELSREKTPQLPLIEVDVGRQSYPSLSDIRDLIR